MSNKGWILAGLVTVLLTLTGGLAYAATSGTGASSAHTTSHLAAAVTAPVHSQHPAQARAGYQWHHGGQWRCCGHQRGYRHHGRCCGRHRGYRHEGRGYGHHRYGYQGHGYGYRHYAGRHHGGWGYRYHSYHRWGGHRAGDRHGCCRGRW